jgi:hypothetical protein
MTPSVISSTPAPVAPAAAAAVVPAAPTAAEFAAQKAELEAAKATAAEHQNTAKYWYDKSLAAKPAAPAAAAAVEEIDLLDLITSRGEKGLKEYLKKQGFVSADEVDAKVNDKASQLTGEAQLVKEYPDLADQKSEFFKATAGFYGELKKEGVPERVAMRMAAKEAKLAGIESGTIKTPAQKTADDKATREEERRARGAAGAGDHGGRTSADEDDDTASPDELLAIKRLAEALEIPLDKATERYKARAQKGVQVAVKIGR